jgi:predicted Zn-dependent protease
MGGHLARTQDELAGASAAAILAAVLGVAAAIATGDGAAGSAIALGGQSAVQRNILQYSRAQESAADQAGVQLLDSVGHSSRGLSNFLEILSDQELLQTSQQDPYLRTHPLSRDRIEALQVHLNTSRYTDVRASKQELERHARMLAKLAGFLDPVGTVLREYPVSDKSIPALYARAVAYHRQGDFGAADSALRQLLAASPSDPYFHELQGQLMFERGDSKAAVAAYANAVTESGSEPLIVFDYARAVLETDDSRRLDDAIQKLEAALRRERESGSGWRLLGTAYGKRGDLGKAALALAESEWYFGRPDLVLQQARRAQDALPRGSSDWLRADDLRLAAERALQQRRVR